MLGMTKYYWKTRRTYQKWKDQPPFWAASRGDALGSMMLKIDKEFPMSMEGEQLNAVCHVEWYATGERGTFKLIVRPERHGGAL